MQGNQVEYLWQGSQRLTNLKYMDLYGSLDLKELPDLSHATNLDILDLTKCKSLVELPSSIGNLHKLEKLMMHHCTSLERIPTNINLACLKNIDMSGCSRLRSFPDISINIMSLDISDTSVEEVPASISMWYCLWSLSIRGTGNLKTITQFHEDLSYTDIEKIPECNDGLDGLQYLYLAGCRRLTSLPELPGSLISLLAENCESLETVSCPLSTPKAHLNFINLACLKNIDMSGCSRLRSFPDISINIMSLDISDTSVEEVPASISMWYCLWSLSIRGTGNLKTITQFHENLWWLDLSYTDIEKIPECNDGLDGLQYLYLAGCRRLTSLPELPGSLISLLAENCESLETVSCPLSTPKAHLNFINCFKLDQQTRRAIMQPQPFLYMSVILPGREVPAEFDHRGHETIGPFPASSRCQACLRISLNKQKQPRDDINLQISYRIIGKSGYAINMATGVNAYPGESSGIQTDHLCIFYCDLPKDEKILLKLGSEIWFEFRDSPFDSCEIIECGVRVLTYEAERSRDGSNKSVLEQVSNRSYEFKPSVVLEESDDSDHTTDGLISCEFESTIFYNYSSESHEASFSLEQLLNYPMSSSLMEGVDMTWKAYTRMQKTEDECEKDQVV